MKVKSFYPVTLKIDGEEIVLRVKRMTLEEHSDFSIQFAKVGTPTYIRFVSRASSGPEQKRNSKGEYVLSFDKIAEKRLAEMKPEKKAEFDAATELDEVQAKEFLNYVCEQFITVERGLIEELTDGTEKSITSGLDFLRIFGARRDVLQQILEAVRGENEMNAEQKKTWRSPIDSSPSLNEQKKARAGPKRETIVKPAAIKDSVSKEDAKGPKLKDQSGSTGTFSSSSAPS